MKTKSTANRYFLLVIMLVAGMFTIASCSSDDDDDNNNGGGGSSTVTGNNSQLVKNGGLLLTSITEGDETYTFGYDELLRPNFYLRDDDDDMFTIDYKAGKMISSYSGTGNVSFNSNGYLTKMQSSLNKDNNEDGVVGSFLATVNYDNNGHIISTESVYEIFEVNGHEYYEKEVTKCVFTWENGNLMKYEDTSTLYKKNGSVDVSNTYTQTFTYSNIPNKYRQYSLTYGDEEEGMFMTGLYGVGPELLPQTVHTTEVEGSYNYENDYRFEFTLNENGTINTEKEISLNGSNVRIDAKYHYTPANEYKAGGTRAAVTLTGNTSANKSKRIKIKEFMRKALLMPTARH